MDSLPKTRKEAKQIQAVAYFTGSVCKNGHVDKRYTNTATCYGCKRKQNKTDRAAHPEERKQISKRSYKNNKPKRLENSKRWAAKNREKSNAIKKKSKLKHADKNKKQARFYQKEKRKNPLWRLGRNTGKAIWASLKGEKGGLKWETFVGFTLGELKTRLEAMFKPEMNWPNYGTYWELDHIKPMSLCSSFEEMWKLDNLQPLECGINRGKCNRYIG
jgi:hypothetical protein